MFKTFFSWRAQMHASVAAHGEQCAEQARLARLALLGDEPERLPQEDIDYWGARFVQRRIRFWTGARFTQYLLNPEYYETLAERAHSRFTRSLVRRRYNARVAVPLDEDHVCPN